MLNYPAKPWSNGALTTDGLYRYVLPPGVWQAVGASLDDGVDDAADLRQEMQAIRIQLENKVDATDIADYIPTAKPSQTLDAIGLATPIDLREGTSVFVRGTTGDWSPTFLNRPAGVTTVHLIVDVTVDDHDFVLPAGFVWEGPTPSAGDFDAGKRYLLEFIVLPDATGTVEWLGEATTTPPEDPGPLTPPTLTGFYSLFTSRTSPTTLVAASLPAGEAVVFFETSDDSIVSKMRVFYNLPGAPPALGAETTSKYWVGNRTPPYSLLGNMEFSSTLSQPWNTTTDPTGTNDVDHDPAGENTITIDAELIDGTLTDPVTFTVTTTNPAESADATLASTLTPYSFANSTHNVTIPDGVDRLVVVTAHYRVTPNLSQSMIIDKLTLGGTDMVEIHTATNDPAITDGAGVFVAYLGEASLSTGIMTLAPSFSSTVNTDSSIVYHVAVMTNVATPTLDADDDFDNVAVGTGVTGAVTLIGVAANSILLTSMSQASTVAADPTCDIGDQSATVSSGDKHKVRASTLLDSGASGDKTATWTGTGRATTVLIAVEYVASGGGPSTPPITPGTPTITDITPGDNQLAVTWSAAVDATSYQISWGGTNPPARTPLSVGNVLTYTITGLVADVLQYVRVRAVSSTSTPGAWSAVDSDTPTGEVTPPPDFSGRFPTSTDAYQVSMTEGNQNWNMGQIVIPSCYRRINIGQTEDASANAIKAGINTFAGGTRDLFISRWQNHPYRTDYHDASGPRLIITGRMTFNNTWSPHLRFDENPQYAIDAVLGMAKSANSSSGPGSINHNWIWESIGTDLNRSVTINGQSFRLADHIFYSISHEPNSWSSNYWGTNTRLINRPEMKVSATSYGTDVKAAMDIVYNTGNLAPLHKLAATNIANKIRSKCPDAILGFSPAENSSSVPVGTPSGNLSNAWPSDAFPEPGVLDFLTPTEYPFRGDGELTFEGGDANDPANWTNDGTGFLNNSLSFANDLGVAYGLLEYSGSYAYPGNTQGLSPGVGTYSDADVAMIHRRFFEVELPSAPNGLCFVNHWLFPTWDQSKADAGRSWIVLEGCYGAAPNGYVFTSTYKPSWSTVPQTEGNLWYQDSLDWFRATFPP